MRRVMIMLSLGLLGLLGVSGLGLYGLTMGFFERVAEHPQEPESPVLDTTADLPTPSQLEYLARTDPVSFLRACLLRYRKEVHGYECTLIKSERLNGKLGPVLLNVQPDCPEEVDLDPTRARQAIQYALLNASTASGGDPIRLTMHGGPDRWVIEVAIDKPAPLSVHSVALSPKTFEPVAHRSVPDISPHANTHSAKKLRLYNKLRCQVATVFLF